MNRPLSRIRTGAARALWAGWKLPVGIGRLGAALVCIAIGSHASAPRTQIQFLSGHGKDDAVPWRFFCTSGAHSGYWTNLPVPSQWDMHGFGTLSYRKDPPAAWNERGLYEHDFTIPASWSGRRVFLVFGGVMTDTDAKLNGQVVGPEHQGGFYQFRYEVTRLLKFDATNRLEVTVAKHSANPSVNAAERDADYWVFGGIYRPVWLEAEPQAFIDRVAVDARADGGFLMDVFLNGVTRGALRAQIQTLDGTAVGPSFGAAISGEKTVLETKISDPKLWSAEAPNLYQVEVRLEQEGKTIHEITQRFGFRTFEVRQGRGLFLNGRRVILKGFDRHSFWPDSGRCLSEAVQRLDIDSIKAMNANAVRMSHYPPDAQFLDLCDEKGLYVLDELAGWHHFYDNPTGARLVREMVRRDVNHPSILFWDNGNEGGFNTNLDKLFDRYDPQQRRVLHPWAPFSGVNTAHYLAYDNARIACQGKPMFYHHGAESVDANDPNTYLYMPTEFQHGLFDGGAGAGLQDYWRMMSASRFLGGGFIWVFEDDAVRRPDTGQMDTAGNQAPDGVVGPYRQREASFYTIKQIWSPIQIRRRKDGSLIVRNLYSFTDASQCRFEWELRRFPNPWEPASRAAGSAPGKDGSRVVARGVIAAPRIPPGGQGLVKIPLPPLDADAFALRVSGPDGGRLWTWVWPLRRHNILTRHVKIAARANHFGGAEAGIVQLKSGGLVARIDSRTGELLSVQRGGNRFSLGGGPRAVGTGAVLKKVAWDLRADGWLQCHYTYAAQGSNEFFGVTFDYPENLVRQKRWLGDGPYRVWKNRTPGTTLGLWENNYNNTITGWRDWIYPEFKGCFAGVRWLQLETAEGKMTVVPRQVPFVQVLNPEFPPPKLVGNAFAPLPQCGLGFLNAIPPIGSKFKPPSSLGPQSQLAVAHGEYSGTISFYFGEFDGALSR